MGYTRNDLPSSSGTYLKAANFPEAFGADDRPTVTISGVEMVTFPARGNDPETQKLVLSFQETEFLMPLNVTNAEIIFDELAGDTDQWFGGKLRLYVGNTKMGPGVKVKVPDQPTPPARTQAETQAESADDDGGEWD
jgi:hypothetical protein